jgi:iron complex transport system substrate-binding protein
MYAQQEAKKVFFVLGISPLFTANKDTYIDDLLTYINAENIAKDFNSSIVSKEYIFRENPDVIIVMNMGIASKELIEKWKNYTFLNAVKYNKIFEVDADKVGSPALPEFIDVIKEIGEKVHR